MARFDAVASRYDDFFDTPLGQFADAVERALIQEMLAPRPGETIGDLGCGTGEHTVALARAGCHVVGIDESPAMLDRARAKPVAGGTAVYLQADLASLPLPAAALDAALIQTALEFVADPAAALAEALRVLRPGGRLVLGLIHGDGPWARHYRERAANEPASIYRHAHFWTMAEIRVLLGADPAAVRTGLYVAPGEFRTVGDAWDLERRRRETEPETAAGYLAVRFDRRSMHIPRTEGAKKAGARRGAAGPETA